MQKIYVAFLIFALAGCNRQSKPTVVPQPQQDKPAETDNQPPATEDADTKIETEETITGTQTGEGTNDEIVDANSNPEPLTDDPTVAPPGNSTTTPETTTDATPTTPVTPVTTDPAATGNINIQGSTITFQDIQFTVPTGWKLHQDTFTDGTLIISFEKDTEYFRMYAKQGSAPDLQSFFVNGSTVVGAEKEQKIAEKDYRRIDTQKGQIFVSGFSLTYKNHAYYGFARSSSTASANTAATEFLSTFK
jgi:hypothetical protein